MNRRNVEAIQTATLSSLNAQVGRMLTLALIKGWQFPSKYDLGVTVIASTALATKVKIRMDDVSFEATVTSTSSADDIVKIADDMVAAWLALHSTGRPTKNQHADG